MVDDSQITPGEALRLLDTEDAPNMPPWSKLRPDKQDSYERQAANALDLAARIQEKMGEPARGAALRAGSAGWLVR